MLTHRRCILADSPGTGKTPTTLAALREANPWRILCVAPKSVLSHWIEEAAVWYPELQVIDGSGPAESRRAARVAVAGHPERPTMLLCNYEAVRSDIDELAGITWGSLVLDEAHRCKNRNALVTKAVRRLVKHPRMWLWMLTGTPIPNRPTEIWSLLNLIDRHRWSSYWRWVEQHCEVEHERYWGGPRGVRVVTGLRAGAVERIISQLSDVLLQRPFEELLPDLPEATFMPVFVDLDPTERRIYDQLVKRTWADLGDGTAITITNEISRMTRLRQVVSSLDALVERDKPGSKVLAAAEICADLEPAQVVVLTWSQAAAEQVAEVTDGRCIHGRTDRREREEILAGFRTGTIRILAGTLATIGEGVDGLQSARYLIRLDRDWVPAKNDQAVARLRRSGQRNAVMVYDLVARKTLDQVIEEALRDKVDVIDAVLATNSGSPINQISLEQ